MFGESESCQVGQRESSVLKCEGELLMKNDLSPAAAARLAAAAGNRGFARLQISSKKTSE